MMSNDKSGNGSEDATTRTATIIVKDARHLFHIAKDYDIPEGLDLNITYDSNHGGNVEFSGEFRPTPKHDEPRTMGYDGSRIVQNSGRVLSDTGRTVGELISATVDVPADIAHDAAHPRHTQRDVDRVSEDHHVVQWWDGEGWEGETPVHFQSEDSEDSDDSDEDLELMTDGGEDERGPFGKDASPFGTSEMSTFESSVRRKMSSNWSLASGVWEMKDESSTFTVDGEEQTSHLVVFYHRDSISRIRVSSSGHWVDTDVQVEVYSPLSKKDARRGPEDDVNDLLVTQKTFDMMGEAVWFAEYFGRSVDDRIPEDPATNLHGPVDGDE